MWIRRVWEEQLHKIERFFLVRTGNATISTAAMDPTEAAEISDHRWWSAREIHLAMGKENFAPGELGQLLPPIIAGEISPEPIEIDS